MEMDVVGDMQQNELVIVTGNILGTTWAQDGTIVARAALVDGGSELVTNYLVTKHLVGLP